MQRLLLLSSLMLTSQLAAAADPTTGWRLAEAEGRNQAARLERTVSRDNWMVETQGNEITVRRKQLVRMVQVLPNAAPGDKPIPNGEQEVRFALRFGPEMSLDEYDRHAAVKAASEKEYDRLHRAVGLPHKFDDFIATTPEEKERVRAFHEAVAKLPRKTLPDFYTPDHCIYFLHSQDAWSAPADEAVAAECREVQDTLLRLFGMYDPIAARQGRAIGQPLPDRNASP